MPKRNVPLYRLPRGLRRRAKEEKKEAGNLKQLTLTMNRTNN